VCCERAPKAARKRRVLIELSNRVVCGRQLSQFANTAVSVKPRFCASFHHFHAGIFRSSHEFMRRRVDCFALFAADRSKPACTASCMRETRAVHKGLHAADLPQQYCSLADPDFRWIILPPTLWGAFWNSAIRPSVCPSVCLSHGAAVCLGYRHAGCLQLSHRQLPEMCGLRTRPRTDVDPLQFLNPWTDADGLIGVETICHCQTAIGGGEYRLVAPGAIPRWVRKNSVEPPIVVLNSRQS